VVTTAVAADESEEPLRGAQTVTLEWLLDDLRAR
jgi:hypothetical protein